jgi:hypothetical protein
MRSRFPAGLFVFVVAVVVIAIGMRFRWPHEFDRVKNVQTVTGERSEIYVRLLIQYPKPPIAEEEYRMQDVEGVSTFDYRIRGYNGRQITITAPAAKVYDVSFFFGALVEDGIWELTNKEPRPDADATYTVYVKQYADFKHGDRTITFTNPKYWATTAGRQYNIDLSKQQPRDLLKLQSSSLADPRYLKIVDDFRQFGPAIFRQHILSAQARVRAGE